MAVDGRVRGGLVVLRYTRFTLVEIASTGSQPIAGKLAGANVRVEPAAVSGAPGLWIEGAHQIAYLDRSGNLQTDTVRRSGPVLVWQRGAVTYRIEGLDRVGALAGAGTVH